MQEDWAEGIGKQIEDRGVKECETGRGEEMRSEGGRHHTSRALHGILSTKGRIPTRLYHSVLGQGVECRMRNSISRKTT